MNTGANMPPNQDNEPRLMGRVVDMKIPLTWLLGGAGALALLLASMYYQLQEVARSMDKLQIIVQTGNNQNAANSGEIAILKFRVEKVESDLTRRQADK